MHEHKRQQYLEAMDIQPWFARKLLPHAKPSVPYRWDCPDDAVKSAPPSVHAGDSSPLTQGLNAADQVSAVAGLATEKAENQAQPAVPAPASGAGRDVLAALKRTALDPDTASVAATPAAPLKARSEPSSVSADKSVLAVAEPSSDSFSAPEVPRCRLEVFALSSTHWAVVDLPHSEVGGFTRFHQSLLQDILRSIDWPLMLDTRNSFHWPLVDNGAIDQGLGVAQDTLRGWLQRDEHWDKASKLLLLGPQAISLLLGDSLEPGKLVREADKTFLLCHSLNAMMKLPELKRDTWRCLQSYLSRVEESN
ncbi:hypothetical protein MIB92_17270 [Aestuariirhabdus sp. Z084]|uniref:hypothetical protein n=1 Tax=Aestuariirhabdus haliotis TaxID=2918751 RepID=UPI00201B42ED|nr:hypothetical protein [Aestuariirhabdus haliotis]MCL6417414.1 hypothetical protein [Aestuariirhabdus haliotis]MCL6421358.1 hypothetical protein [Aestuariirhabdus haliotis]